MADDPGHKAMLYFLEVLMNSGVPLSIGQLAGRFGSKNFTADMRQSSGGNDAGLKKFLLKYPSLFSVIGNFVSLNDGTASLGGNFRESSPASTSSGVSQTEVSVETEAVQYFRGKMVKKGEMWVPIKSIAGHLSQAIPEIRECVGPQNEFCTWLASHPLIFDMKGDMVSLKDNVTYSAVNPNAEPIDDPYLRRQIFPNAPPTTSTPKVKRRPKSLDITQSFSPPKPPQPTNTKAGPVTMTANEYKAIMFIKGALDDELSLDEIYAKFSEAPESLRNTVGWSKPELKKFLIDHSNIFIMNNDMISIVKNARLNVIITGSRPSTQAKPTVVNRKGKLYHVSKLWAIIDLGKHEHVFIDRCIFGKHVDDLRKYLSVGEIVSFNAIPAEKGSRAKWKAVKVWNDNETFEDIIEKARLRSTTNPVCTPTTPAHNVNMDQEMVQYIPELNDSVILDSPITVGGLKYAFSDAAPSGAGIIPIWNSSSKHAELEGMRDIDDLNLSDDFDGDSVNVSMIAERYHMNRSVLSDSQPESKPEKPVTNGEEKSAAALDKLKSAETSPSENKMMMVDCGCQTIVTGDVLATQLFHDEI